MASSRSTAVRGSNLNNEQRFFITCIFYFPKQTASQIPMAVHVLLTAADNASAMVWYLCKGMDGAAVAEAYF